LGDTIATNSLLIHNAHKNVDIVLVGGLNGRLTSGNRVDTVVVDGKSNKDCLYSIAARD
jgi:hypothetical protein